MISLCLHPRLRRTHRDRVFVNERIRLDRANYRDCTFQNCNVEFSGGPIELHGNHFRDCRWTFSGVAGRTVGFMKHLNGMAPSLITETFYPTEGAGS